MIQNPNNSPAEIFGYLTEDCSLEAKEARQNQWCPFVDKPCNKKSRLIHFAFGVCSVNYRGKIHSICPRRFEQKGNIPGISKVLEDIALHYFGDFNNIIAFSEVSLPKIGNIDYVLVRHKPMIPQVEDFVAVEFQSDSTTGTGGLVQAIQDFFDDRLQQENYKFGMNTYDSIKRAITQLINKGIVYEKWNTKCYWVIQEYIYANLVNRYKFKESGFSTNHSSCFALYDFDKKGNYLKLDLKSFISTTVDEVYQAMRNNPDLPTKDEFIIHLNSKLDLKLNLDVH